MAMQTAERKDNEPACDINTTPLIDVMLVLLIMLIVTLPQPQHAIKVDTPQTSQTPPISAPPRPISIAIDYDGSVSWNDVPIGLPDLDSRLRIEARREQQPEIHIKPHPMAKYGYVAHVMASVQREGLTKLGVVGGA
jgi:biopolymer transport protein ExbD